MKTANKRFFLLLTVVLLVAVMSIHALQEDMVKTDVSDVVIEDAQLKVEIEKEENCSENKWYKKKSIHIAIAAVVLTIVIYIIAMQMYVDKKSVSMGLLGICGTVPPVVVKSLLREMTPLPEKPNFKPDTINSSMHAIVLTADCSGDNEYNNASCVQHDKANDLMRQSFLNVHDNPDATNGSISTSGLNPDNGIVKNGNNGGGEGKNNVLQVQDTGNANDLRQQLVTVPTRNEEQVDDDLARRLISKLASFLNGFEKSATGIRMR